VRPFVNLEVFRTGENFPAARERTREGLLPRVHSDVVDQLVLGFERLPFPQAFLPEADVGALLGSADVLHGDVVHQFVHGAVGLGAGLLVGRVLLVDPFAD